MAQKVSANDMALEDWEKLYWKKDGSPPFHLKIVHPLLEKFYDKLFEDGKPQRVFVPLCGKTLDMIFLADKGLEVVGLEFAKVAVDSFFKENNLTVVESKVENEPFIKYEVKEKKITIYRGDMFEVTSGLVGKFDVVWDRGSFRAINISSREAYLDIVRSILKPEGRILMEVCDYDPACDDKGAPYPLAKEDIPKYFGKNFQIDVVDTSERNPPRHFDPDLKFVMHTIFLALKN